MKQNNAISILETLLKYFSVNMSQQMPNLFPQDFVQMSGASLGHVSRRGSVVLINGLPKARLLVQGFYFKLKVLEKINAP